MSWLMTYSGVKFPLLNPTKDHFKLIDIAHALSLINRYGGHTKYRYSVGLHCLLGAEKMLDDGHGYLLQLYFLLHDAAEAYYGDIPRPLKKILGEDFENLEDYAMDRVWEAFNLRPPTDEEYAIVKYYDNLMLSNEIPKLMVNPLEYEVELRDDSIPIIRENELEVELAFKLAVGELLKRVISSEEHIVHTVGSVR